MSWARSNSPSQWCPKCSVYVVTADELTEVVHPEHLMGGVWAPNAWAVKVDYTHHCGATFTRDEVRARVPDATDE